MMSDPMVDVGLETTAYQRNLCAHLLAILLLLLCVGKEMSLVIWDQMLDAGWETTACLKTLCVHLLAIPQLHLCVGKEK